jgi:hypothetical protein
MKRLMIAAVAAVLASPAVAQSLAPSPADIQAHRLGTPQFNNRAPSRTSAGPLSAFGAVTPFGSPVPQASRTEREASVRDCNLNAQKYTQHLWSNLEFQQYRICMAQRGQAE